MIDWPVIALRRIRLGEPVAMITLLAVEGSAPRGAGTRMLVWPSGQWGTVGGGNLEHQTSAQARRMLAATGAPAFAVQDYPLGPLLGQCCGGRVRLIIEALCDRDAAWLTEIERLTGSGVPVELRARLGDSGVARSAAPATNAGPAAAINGTAVQARGAKPAAGDDLVCRTAATPSSLLLFGAGHVGRAVAQALRPLPFCLHWYDSRLDVAAETGATLATPDALRRIAAEPTPYTLVLTHDHGLDYALVLAALGGGGGYLGLIGSRTKRARFIRRLRADGVGEEALGRLVCPIGLPTLAGKAPEVIAVSTAADLLIRLEAAARASL